MAESFCWKIQKLLLKKEQEYGQLKFVVSRATKKTSDFIDKLVQDIIDIAHMLQMQEVSEENNVIVTPLTALCYNYFLLNTNFSTQDLFTEDLTYGHIVGVWPTLSPYLFIQIIWHSKCETILGESLTYLPLDLCVDILEITITCINELETERAMNLIFFLIFKVYDKCLLLQQGTLSAKSVTERVCQLVANFQALLDLLGGPKFAGSSKLSDEVKYKQHGMFLKRILCLTKKCMKRKIVSTNNQSTAKLLTLTYGNPNGRPTYHNTLPIDKIKSTMTTLDQELVNLLLNQIKIIDCYEYMGWAEIDDKENVMISLQRAIIIECHYFMKFMKKDDFLKNDHLHQCLQQLTGLTNSEQTILTLQEICHEINNGRLENMRELMKRYKEWDQSTLDFIEENAKLLMKNDCYILLEYLHHMFMYSHVTKQNKYKAYTLVLKVILQQNMPNMYGIIQKYVLQHFNDNRLTYLYNEQLFKTFMARNLNMRDPQVLRTLLIFILIDAKTVLTVLVRIVIGCKNYTNIVFTPNNMLLLRSFLCATVNNQCSILTYILKDVSLEDTTWSYKSFICFIDAMLDNQVITADDLINNVYIPYLIGSPFYYFNLVSILMHMYDILRERVTYEINYTLLIIVLIKRMSIIRKCDATCPRTAVNDLINHITRILDYLLYKPNLLTVNQQRDVINATANCVEPIDRIRLGPLEHNFKNYVLDIIQDYERRCFVVHRQLRTNSRSEPLLREYARSFQLNRETFILHMILHSTETEYETFALQLTLMFWCHFGWINEMEAYENVLRITGQAARMVLVFKETFPIDMFVVLLRVLIHFCNTLARVINRDLNKEKILRILLDVLSSLKEPANRTCYGQMYTLFIARISDNCINELYGHVNVFLEINEWLEVYLVQCDKMTISPKDCESLDDETSSVYTRQDQTNEELHMFQAYKFVCECIRVFNMNTQFYIQLMQNIFPITE